MEKVRDIRKITSVNEKEEKRMHRLIDKIRKATGDRNYNTSAFIRDAINEKLSRELGK